MAVAVVVGTQQSPGHRGSVATVTSAVQYWLLAAGVLGGEIPAHSYLVSAANTDSRGTNCHPGILRDHQT